MTAKIDYNPDDLKKIISALNGAEANIVAALSGAKGALRAADWNDAQRVKFEQMLSASDRRLARFAEESEAMKAFLQKLVRLADQYGST